MFDIYRWYKNIQIILLEVFGSFGELNQNFLSQRISRIFRFPRKTRIDNVILKFTLFSDIINDNKEQHD